MAPCLKNIVCYYNAFVLFPLETHVIKNYWILSFTCAVTSISTAKACFSTHVSKNITFKDFHPDLITLLASLSVKIVLVNTTMNESLMNKKMSGTKTDALIALMFLGWP